MSEKIFHVWTEISNTMATNLPSCFFIQFLEQLLKFLVNFTLLKYVKSQRSYGFLITKELISGFQILDLKDHFSASLKWCISENFRLKVLNTKTLLYRFLTYSSNILNLVSKRRNNSRTCLRSGSKEGFKAVNISIANISCKTH